MSIVFASDNLTFATRGESDQTIFVWNITNPSKPMLEINNVPNDYPTANLDFRYLYYIILYYNCSYF